MFLKQLEFIVNRIMDEACDITVDFWRHQVSLATMQEVLSYENDRVRVMKISTGVVWFLSYGEDYHMVFERLPEDIKKTKITITINLKLGFGPQWKRPSDVLKKWTLLLDLEPIDFGTKIFRMSWLIVGLVFAIPIMLGIIILIIRL